MTAAGQLPCTLWRGVWTIARQTNSSANGSELLGFAFQKPRHDFDEVAWAVPIVELPFQYPFPSVAARSWGARQAKNECCVRDARTSAGLNGRRSHLFIRDHVEERREAINLFFEQWAHSVRCYIAAGKSGAAGGKNAIDIRRRDPCGDFLPYDPLVVSDERSVFELVACFDQKFGQE